MTADGPGQRQRPPRARPQHAVARACRARAGRSCGSGCGRRSPRSPPPRACSSPSPGSDCGSRCRRSAAPSACSCSSCWPSPRRCRCSWCGCRRTNDGLRRLDRASLLPHRPATAIADELVPEASDQFASALWRAHMERALRAASTLRAGIPLPRAGGARSLCAARAGAGPRGRDLLRRRQRAHQARRRGVRLAGRGGAGQLPDRRLGDAADLHRPAAADPAGRCVPASRCAIVAAGVGARRLDAGGALDRQGRLQRRGRGRHRRAARRRCAPAGAGRHRGAPLHHHRHRQRDRARRRRQSGVELHRDSGPRAGDRARQGAGRPDPRRAAACPTRSRTTTA